jgi:hypothetical protein
MIRCVFRFNPCIESIAAILLFSCFLCGCGETGQRGPIDVSKLEAPLASAVIPGVATVQNEFFDVVQGLAQRYAGWENVEVEVDHFIVKTKRMVRESYSMTSFIAVYLTPSQSEIVFGYGAIPTHSEEKMLSGLKKKIHQIIARKRSSS